MENRLDDVVEKSIGGVVDIGDAWIASDSVGGGCCDRCGNITVGGFGDIVYYPEPFTGELLEQWQHRHGDFIAEYSGDAGHADRIETDMLEALPVTRFWVVNEKVALPAPPNPPELPQGFVIRNSSSSSLATTHTVSVACIVGRTVLATVLLSGTNVTFSEGWELVSVSDDIFSTSANEQPRRAYVLSRIAANVTHSLTVTRTIANTGDMVIAISLVSTNRVFDVTEMWRGVREVPTNTAFQVPNKEQGDMILWAAVNFGSITLRPNPRDIITLTELSIRGMSAIDFGDGSQSRTFGSSGSVRFNISLLMIKLTEVNDANLLQENVEGDDGDEHSTAAES